ncbi:MAG: hypothetical protein ACOX8E_04045 [Ruminococcus sp.]|jgi:hypothetical protein
MKVWGKLETKGSSHYALRMTGRILCIVMLAAALVGGSVFLMFYFEERKEIISAAACVLITALLLCLALRAGRKSRQEASFFVQDDEGRMFFLDAGEYVKGGHGIAGFVKMAADTEKQIDRIKDYVNHKWDLSMVASQIISVENIKENSCDYALICRVCLPGGQNVRKTILMAKGYDREEELLLALEQRRYRERAWEVQENRTFFYVIFSGILFLSAVVLCIMSHPAVGILSRNIYFPCLGIAFLLFGVMMFFIVKQRRGE